MEDLDIISIVDAGRDRLTVGYIITAHHHHRLTAVLRGKDGRERNLQCFLRSLSGDRSAPRSANLVASVAIVETQPDLHGRAAGIERRADKRDLSGNRL